MKKKCFVQKLSQKSQKLSILCNLSALSESLSALITNLKEKYYSKVAKKLLDPSISPEVRIENNFKQ